MAKMAASHAAVGSSMRLTTAWNTRMKCEQHQRGMSGSGAHAER